MALTGGCCTAGVCADYRVRFHSLDDNRAYVIAWYLQKLVLRYGAISESLPKRTAR